MKSVAVLFVCLAQWEFGVGGAEEESGSCMEKNAEFTDYILSNQPLPLVHAAPAESC